MKQLCIDNINDNKDLLKIDYLTQFANRRGIYEYYNDINKTEIIHVVFIDVDNFKRINDLYGHSVGDTVLSIISNVLRKKFSNSQISRIGGDEFIVIIDGSVKGDEVIEIIESFIKDIEKLDDRKDIFSNISLSIGVVLDQNVNQSFDDLLAKCDHVMYEAKAKRDNGYIIYKSIEEDIETDRSIKAEMMNALEERQFVVYLQPKVNMINMRLVGAEALVRWDHPVDGLRFPGQFIPLFEKNGFIAKLDLYVFEEVCKMKNKLKGTEYENICISVNISRIHLFHRHFPDILKSIADSYGVPTRELEIEVTESVFIKNKMKLVEIINQFREYGFYVSIDDFGSGYSALNMLKDITAEIIKIDKEFLRLSSDDERGKKVLKNVINMCKDLKMEVITEGVETKEQAEFVVSCGCQIAQGYYYAKPMDFDKFMEFADEITKDACDEVEFTFDNTLESDDKTYSGKYVPEKNSKEYKYVDGIIKGKKAIRLFGGRKELNLIKIPHKLISTESFSIMLWVRIEEINNWTSVFYVKYEMGFISIVPRNDQESADFRMRDSRDVDGWYDVYAPKVEQNEWTHLAITYDANFETGKIYVNGKCMGQLGGMPALRYAKLIYVGGDVFQDSLKGDICNLIIYSVVKSDEEIKEKYDSYVDDENFIGS